MSGDLVESVQAFLSAGRAAWPGVAASNDLLTTALARPGHRGSLCN